MYPNKIQSLTLVAALITSQLIISFYLAASGISGNNGAPVNFILTSITSCALMLFLALPKMHLKVQDLFHANFNSLRKLLFRSLIPIAVLMGAMQVILAHLYDLYSGFLPKDNPTNEYIALLLESGVIGFLCICIVAPLIEEIIFRGIILRGLLANYSPGDALVTSAVLFSLFHFNPDQLLQTLIAGMVLGWIYIKSYSLWPSIVAHSWYNMIAFIVASSEASYLENHSPPSLIIFVLAALVSLMALRKIFSSSLQSP